MTNLERIRNMSIDELAHYLAILNGGGAKKIFAFKKWLEREETK